MSELLERAIWLAAEAHSGHIDKAGAPYIRHVMRVCQAVDDPIDRTVAALHDVLEDCPDWSAERLRAEGFPDAVVEAVLALTRGEDESYGAFIERVALNPIARRVKLADLRDNSDLSRLPHPGPADHARLRKYERAYARLTATP